MKQLKASEIYASQLVHLGYGHPLWYPEPAKSGEVEIGDVGYIDDGHFHRLFNACRDQNHILNKAGVPAGFEPLRLPEDLLHDRSEVVKPGESLCSDSVRKVKAEVKAESPTSLVSVSGGYSFNTKGKRGAVAVLKDGGTQQSVSRSEAFQRYILNSHPSWHAFARQRGVSLKVQDIVLVSGFVKTSEWALAEYNNEDTSHEASLTINASSMFSLDSSFSLEEQNKIGLRHRVGPRPQDAHSPVSPPDSPLNENIFLRPQNQCVFLQYYKCRPKALGLVTLRKPQNLKPKDMLDSVGDECFCAPLDGLTRWVKRCFGGCRRDIEAETKPQERSTEDPVTALLCYISKSSPGDVAVTSHTDLYDLLRGTKWPANVGDYLKDKRPKITVDKNGAAKLDVEAFPKPPAVPEKSLPPVPPLRSTPSSTPSVSPKPPAPPRDDSMDDVGPSPPGGWRDSSRRKTLLTPLDVRATRLQATESIDSRLGAPAVRHEAPLRQTSRRAHSSSSTRSP